MSACLGLGVWEKQGVTDKVSLEGDEKVLN